MSRKKKTKGFVVVASANFYYYVSAINLIHSIKEFCPDSKVCLVTEEKFLDKGADIADDIVICGDHKRDKIWGMSNCPYDKCFYIDADCEVVHEDIKTVFDKFDGNDVLFTALVEERSYIYAEYGWGTEGLKFDWCGGVCLFDKSKPLVKTFLDDWYDLTVKQYEGSWWPTKENGERNYDQFPKSLARWDQFSLWWLLNREEKYKKLKVGRLDKEEDARWNHFYGYAWDHTNGKEPVIQHYSASQAKADMRNDYR